MRLRIAVSGMLAGDCGQGGATWAILQYVLGLRRLGHEVVFVEPVDAAALADGPADRLRGLAAAFGIEQAALVDPGARRAAGLPYARLRALLRSADALLNVSGMLADEALVGAIPVRAYVDLDPCFNQVWELQGTTARLDGHTHFVTVGTAIGRPGCAVPTLGRDWIATLPPVVLERWPVQRAAPDLPFTTVAHWRSYGPVEHDGRRYGLRAHAMRQLIDLPRRTGARFAVALGIDPAETRDLAALRRHGWRLLDPADAAATPAAYGRFIARSSAEVGIAKHGYVASRCGWFSDRSACYLASGRPVLAQDTGFGAALPAGDGLLAFATADEAAAGADDVLARYPAHRRAARALAEDLLDSDRVLGRLLDRLGATA